MKNLDPNDTIMAILRYLIKSKGSTIYGIAKALKIPQQKIGYHMPGLEEAGLILSDELDGVRIYIPQPILMDEEFTKIVDDALTGIYEAAAVASEKLYTESEKPKDIGAVFENCIRTKVILSLCQNS